MKSLVYRIVGPAPGNDAARSARLRWIRRLNWRCNTPFAVLGVVLLLVWLPWYYAAICAAFQAYALASISISIRREEREERTGGS